MPFRKITWRKSEEKPKLGIDGVCHGDAVPPIYRSRPPHVKLVVQPLGIIRMCRHNNGWITLRQDGLGTLEQRRGQFIYLFILFTRIYFIYLQRHPRT